MTDPVFNCECDDLSTNDTLVTLRRRLMRRLGYAAQATNPPPGMADLLDDFVRDAQLQLYLKNPSLKTERYFRWSMETGIRYYGIRDQDSDTAFSDITCNRDLRAQQVTWVGMQDANDQWVDLIQGINPQLYTSVANTGRPAYFEIRECIEVFPAPDANTYRLWVRGKFEPEPLVADSDRTTLDSELVFLLALGNAKLHYNRPDAQATLQQADTMLKALVAGTHGVRRYVPGRPKLPALVRPTMVAFDG
jgi:hypothetical protein